MSDKAAHVAILDDDPDQLLALSKWLGEAGYETSTFNRGAALLKFLKTPLADGATNADAALVDWGLPDMSGVEVIQQMRDVLKLDIPIILITSRNSEQDIVEGLEAGADDYLVKPARHMECIARVEAALRRANSIRVERQTGIFWCLSFRCGRARSVVRQQKSFAHRERASTHIVVISRYGQRSFAKHHLEHGVGHCVESGFIANH
jgi:DNA-binding response OmpR family regulator